MTIDRKLEVDINGVEIALLVRPERRTHLLIVEVTYPVRDGLETLIK